jgi:Sigma-70, region 4/SnoaL-like domain
VTTDLLARAQAGDGEAFGRLTGHCRRELQVHCYRILGSAQDAEDALQETLLPRQRAVLILRDVLGFRAREVADILEASLDSVTSALKRARATLQSQLPPSAERDPPPPPGSAAEQALIAQFTRAFETGDVDGLVALLTEDVWMTMPPVPLEYQGRELTARFLTTVSFRPDRTFRLVPTRANGQPAFGAYVRDPQTKIFHANGLIVVTLSGRQVCAMARFDDSALSRFGLPRTLPG